MHATAEGASTPNAKIFILDKPLYPRMRTKEALLALSALVVLALSFSVLAEPR
jgi:hypothetical protein